MAPEMYEKNSTIEYVFSNPKAKQPPPCFIFVLDIVNSSKKEELICAKDAVQQCMGQLPQFCKVAFITFGKNVQVHQLCNNEIQTITVVRGTRTYSQKEVEQVLRLVDKHGNKTNFISKQVSSFDDCQVQLSSVLDNLAHDDWSQDPTHRPEICTGVAVQCAATLATHLVGAVGCGRVLLLTSGVCTVGSGKIVDIPQDTKMRMYNDIYNKDAAMTRYVSPAKQFYEGQAKALNSSNFAFDIICASVDQMGLQEMKILCEKTGGSLVFNDTYMSDVFKKSLIKIFTKNKEQDDEEEEEEEDVDEDVDLPPSLENSAQNCQIKVISSNNVRICGCIGHCFGLKEGANKQYVSEIKIGECDTNIFRMGQCDRTQSYAIQFETKNDLTTNVPNAFVQLQFLQYNAETQEKRMRVTTIRKIFSAHENALTDIKEGFDQDAAFILFARITIRKIDTEPCVQDVVRWLDKQLIKFCHKMGKFIQDVPTSFKLTDKLELFPVQVYQFRRSTLLRIFNMSPDEAEMYRMYFFRENVNNSLSIVQSSLISFDKDYSWNIVDLDVNSLKHDCVLVMDSFKEIVVWKGESVQKLEVNSEMTENVEWMINESVKQAKDQARSRFPFPRIIVCHAGSGPERFLKNKVNPSTSSFKDPNNEDSGNFFTDEFGLSTFMNTLKKQAVTD